MFNSYLRLHPRVVTIDSPKALLSAAVQSLSVPQPALSSSSDTHSRVLL